MNDLKPQSNLPGVVRSLAVITSWLFALSVSLFIVKWNELNLTLQVPAVLILTFLSTGLFIVAHDAMHGLIAPLNAKLNDFIGSSAIFMYAGFSYAQLLSQHKKHHHTPADDGDPDYHDGKNPKLFAWFFHFMKNYISIRPFVFFTTVYIFFVYGLGVEPLAVIIGWALPAVLSSFQLFFFGTYLPHRQPPHGYNDERAESNAYPEWLSFLTCYHFGYHYEHHKLPYVPWWRLPEARRRLLKLRDKQT